MLTGGTISWKSAKQTLITSSIMVVEFVDFFEAFNHGIWMQNLVPSLCVVDGIERPLSIYCDNNATI